LIAYSIAVAVRRADVLEDRAVPGLLRVMVDHQVRAVEHSAEVMGLHVHGRNPIETLERRGGDLLDLDVEHVRHAEVFRPRHALDGADDRRRLRAPQKVPQREAACQCVGIGIVVQQNQDAIRVREIALILLDSRARHRTAQFGHKRGPQQFGEVHVRDLRAFVVGAAVGPVLAGVKRVDQRASGIADGFDDFLDAAFARVLDDETGVGGDVGFQVGVDAFGIAG
jgi:hypothetical protein